MPSRSRTRNINGALGSANSLRTIAIGCAVASIVCTVAIVRPKALPLPHISLSFASAAAADSSVITISSAEAQQASAIVTSIDDVHSEQDLVAYADALMRADSRISQIRIGEHSVSMTYLTDNTILNVKTLSDMTRATVSSDGSVTISGSWYRPLFTKVAQASSPNVGFSDIRMEHDASNLTPSTEARILARLQGRFRIGAIQ